jgi:hypothetical protein
MLFNFNKFWRAKNIFKNSNEDKTIPLHRSLSGATVALLEPPPFLHHYTALFAFYI